MFAVCSPSDYRSDVVEAQLVEKTIRSFNTWSFKREQPSSIEQLRNCVAQAIARRSPLRFVLYWGKGPRQNIAVPDLQCLTFLSTMARSIGQTYAPGAHMTLICTDTHARHNGHAKSPITRYFNAIGRAAFEHGIDSCRLSALVAALPPKTPAGEPPLQTDVLNQLMRSAARWYRGNGDIEAGARQYYAMNMIEKDAVAQAFPDAIFITFNGSDIRALFPETLPIFYMYSLKRGTAVKPWFLTSSGGDAVAKLSAAPNVIRR